MRGWSKETFLILYWSPLITLIKLIEAERFLAENKVSPSNSPMLATLILSMLNEKLGKLVSKERPKSPKSIFALSCLLVSSLTKATILLLKRIGATPRNTINTNSVMPIHFNKDFMILFLVYYGLFLI